MRRGFYKHGERGYFHKAPGRGFWERLDVALWSRLAMAIQRPNHSGGGYDERTGEGDVYLCLGHRYGLLRRDVRRGRWAGPWRREAD
jgi:hypothetical protein